MPFLAIILLSPVGTLKMDFLKEGAYNKYLLPNKW